MTLKHVLASAALAATLPFAGVARAQAVTAVPNFDFNRFSGTWYEVARLPSKAEKKCIGTPLALYARGDKPNRIQVVNSCPAKDGSTEIRNAAGKPADKSGAGKLKLSYIFPFTQKQWVLALGASDDWALVGSPNHKNLWVLSRTAAITPQALAEAQAKAAAQGFEIGRMILAPPPLHTRHPAAASTD